MSWLGTIAHQISDLGLEYEFGDYSGTSDSWWVGEYLERPVLDENGESNLTFLLTGHSRNSFGELESQKELVREKYRHGFRAILDDGTGIHIVYSNALFVPTADESINRIEVSLDVKLWRT